MHDIFRLKYCLEHTVGDLYITAQGCYNYPEMGPEFENEVLHRLSLQLPLLNSLLLIYWDLSQGPEKETSTLLL